MSVSSGLAKVAASPSQATRLNRARLLPLEHAITEIASVPTRIKHRAAQLGRSLGEVEQAVGRGLRRGSRLSSASGMPKRFPGENFAAAREKRMKREGRKSGKPVMRGELDQVHKNAPAEVEARRQKLKRNGKPSFWQKHPVITGLSGAAAYKAVFGGKDEDKDKTSPYVVYPNQ